MSWVNPRQSRGFTHIELLHSIEVGKQAMAELPHIIPMVAERPERFILYCDDLSFNADEPGYQALKAALQWNIQRGSRSGRVAWQFAKDQAGRLE